MTTSRARLPETALAWAASLAALAPLSTLFTPNSWLLPAVAVVTVVALVGASLRAVSAPAWLVAMVQLVVALEVCAVQFTRDTLWFVLPTGQTVQAFGTLLGEAVSDISRYHAPVPLSPGLSASLGLVAALVAIATDVVAVTLRAPAAAGLAVLTAYLLSATNSGTGLGFGWFLAPAALWLALLAREGLRSLHRWGHGALPPREPTVRTSTNFGFSTVARRLGAAAIGLAIVVPAVVPHLPTTFVADGLGRGPGGEGTLTLASTLDVRRSLRDPSTDPVMTYTSSIRTGTPLRVDVLDSYVDGGWSASARGGVTHTSSARIPDGAAEDLKRSAVEVVVRGSQLRAPQIALPAPATSVDTGGTDWSVDSAGTVHVAGHVPDYRSTFSLLTPAPNDFEVTDDGQVDPILLSVPPEVSETLTRTVDEVTRQTTTPLERAQAIQAFLRGSDFVYSLTVQAPVNGEDPVESFLRVRRGYCVQFATTMVLMARSVGIPARLAVGFLPGTLGDDGYTVLASDAHAWPELYFARIGWVRFEPTPGVRSGQAPAYSVPRPSVTSSNQTSQPSVTGSASPTTSRGKPLDENEDLGTQVSTWQRVQFWVRGHLGLLGLALLPLLALLALPLGARLSRRRARRRARNEAELVEAAWQSLVQRLDDVGIRAEPGATPRQAGREMSRDAHLDGAADRALGRVVATLERTRYSGHPEGDPGSVDDDVRQVYRAARRRSARRVRLAAVLAPSAGRDYWRSLGDRFRRH